MFDLRFFKALILAGLLALLASGCAAKLGAAPDTPEMRAAQAALADAMSRLSATASTPDILLITNAGYANAKGEDTAPYYDLAMRATGRTPGSKSLLSIVTPPEESLWFSLYRPSVGKLVFLRKTDQGFDRQTVDLDPKTILTAEGWTKAAKGPMGPRTFSAVSISMSWSVGATWPMLLAAQLHDHFCPGLNAGFIILEYVKHELPLGPGDSYVFIGAPPFCAMDAFQVLTGRTVGKRGTLAMMNAPDAGAFLADGGVSPSLIILRVNAKKDRCDGVVLGLDWSKVGAATGVSPSDLRPKGGKSNPLFYVSRTTMSYKLAQMPLKDKMPCVKPLYAFTGPASIAARITNGGSNPYMALP